MVFDKDLAFEVAVIIGFLSSYAFAALLLVRREKEKDFWNIIGLVACLTFVFVAIGVLVGAAVYFVFMVFAFYFLG